jgi:hypothetical protein
VVEIGSPVDLDEYWLERDDVDKCGVEDEGGKAEELFMLAPSEDKGRVVNVDSTEDTAGDDEALFRSGIEEDEERVVDVVVLGVVEKED